MAKQKYNAFKEQLKQWMIDNSDDYEEFEDMMNNHSGAGYNSILLRAVSLLPKFEKAVKNKYNCNNIPDISDISDIVEIAKEEKLAEKLLAKLNLKNGEKFIPAMLAWLYYGRSFENMLEHGEEILKLPHTKWYEKIYVSFGMKTIVRQSIKLEFRTEEDWERYNKLRSIITEGKTIDWVTKKTDDKKESESVNEKDIPFTQQTLSDITSFASMLSLTRNDKEILIAKIANYLSTNARGKAIALMILALQELYYLPQISSYKSLFKAIRTYFNVEIGSDRGIYLYIEEGMAHQYRDEVGKLVGYFKVN